MSFTGAIPRGCRRHRLRPGRQPWLSPGTGGGQRAGEGAGSSTKGCPDVPEKPEAEDVKRGRGRNGSSRAAIAFGSQRSTLNGHLGGHDVMLRGCGHPSLSTNTPGDKQVPRTPCMGTPHGPSLGSSPIPKPGDGPLARVPPPLAQ